MQVSLLSADAAGRQGWMAKRALGWAGELPAARRVPSPMLGLSQQWLLPPLERSCCTEILPRGHPVRLPSWAARGCVLRERGTRTCAADGRCAAAGVAKARKQLVRGGGRCEPYPIRDRRRPAGFVVGLESAQLLATRGMRRCGTYGTAQRSAAKAAWRRWSGGAVSPWPCACACASLLLGLRSLRIALHLPHLACVRHPCTCLVPSHPLGTCPHVPRRSTWAMPSGG